MTMTGTVSIPADHFAKRVRNEYSDPHTAMVREFVQNSVDAGASRIDITTSDTGLTVRDNGRGIQVDRMVEALLTLGGSVKDGESIGGYGIAKEILLFAHESYSIRTLNSRVAGSVLSYELETVSESFPGAEFSIKFAPGFRYDRGLFIDRARRFLASCQLSAEVYLDGQQVMTNLRGRKIDLPFQHGSVLVRRMPKGEECDRMVVRVNGLTMFSQYVRPSDKQVIVELVGDIRSMLTSNRDGLRYPFSDELNTVVQSVVIDPKSFDRKKAERTVYPGRDASYYSRLSTSVAEVFSGLLPETQVWSLASDVRRAVEAGQPIASILQSARTEVEKATGHRLDDSHFDRITESTENFSTDFVVSIEGTELRTAPKACRPATMKRSYRQLAQLWKYLLDECIKVSGAAINYRVGFVLDPEKCAYYSKTGEGEADILINPEKLSETTDKRERFMRVLILAAHELAHRDHKYHDEGFVLEQERILRLTLAKLPHPVAVMRAARAVSL